MRYWEAKRLLGLVRLARDAAEWARHPACTHPELWLNLMARHNASAREIVATAMARKEL